MVTIESDLRSVFGNACCNVKPNSQRQKSVDKYDRAHRKILNANKIKNLVRLSKSVSIPSFDPGASLERLLDIAKEADSLMDVSRVASPLDVINVMTTEKWKDDMFTLLSLIRENSEKSLDSSSAYGLRMLHEQRAEDISFQLYRKQQGWDTRSGIIRAMVDNNANHHALRSFSTESLSNISPSSIPTSLINEKLASLIAKPDLVLHLETKRLEAILSPFQAFDLYPYTIDFEDASALVPSASNNNYNNHSMFHNPSNSTSNSAGFQNQPSSNLISPSNMLPVFLNHNNHSNSPSSPSIPSSNSHTLQNSVNSPNFRSIEHHISVERIPSSSSKLNIVKVTECLLSLLEFSMNVSPDLSPSADLKVSTPSSSVPPFFRNIGTDLNFVSLDSFDLPHALLAHTFNGKYLQSLLGNMQSNQERRLLISLLIRSAVVRGCLPDLLRIIRLLAICRDPTAIVSFPPQSTLPSQTSPSSSNVVFAANSTSSLSIPPMKRLKSSIKRTSDGMNNDLVADNSTSWDDFYHQCCQYVQSSDPLTDSLLEFASLRSSDSLLCYSDKSKTWTPVTWLYSNKSKENARSQKLISLRTQQTFSHSTIINNNNSVHGIGVYNEHSGSSGGSSSHAQLQPAHEPRVSFFSSDAQVQSVSRLSVPLPAEVHPSRSDCMRSCVLAAQAGVVPGERAQFEVTIGEGMSNCPFRLGVLSSESFLIFEDVWALGDFMGGIGFGSSGSGNAIIPGLVPNLKSEGFKEHDVVSFIIDYPADDSDLSTATLFVFVNGVSVTPNPTAGISLHRRLLRPSLLADNCAQPPYLFPALSCMSSAAGGGLILNIGHLPFVHPAHELSTKIPLLQQQPQQEDSSFNKLHHSEKRNDKIPSVLEVHRRRAVASGYLLPLFLTKDDEKGVDNNLTRVFAESKTEIKKNTPITPPGLITPLSLLPYGQEEIEDAAHTKPYSWDVNNGKIPAAFNELECFHVVASAMLRAECVLAERLESAFRQDLESVNTEGEKRSQSHIPVRKVPSWAGFSTLDSTAGLSMIVSDILRRQSELFLPSASMKSWNQSIFPASCLLETNHPYNIPLSKRESVVHIPNAQQLLIIFDHKCQINPKHSLVFSTSENRGNVIATFNSTNFDSSLVIDSDRVFISLIRSPKKQSDNDENDEDEDDDEDEEGEVRASRFWGYKLQAFALSPDTSTLMTPPRAPLLLDYHWQSSAILASLVLRTGADAFPQIRDSGVVTHSAELFCHSRYLAKEDSGWAPVQFRGKVSPSLFQQLNTSSSSSSLQINNNAEINDNRLWQFKENASAAIHLPSLPISFLFELLHSSFILLTSVLSHAPLALCQVPFVHEEATGPIQPSRNGETWFLLGALAEALVGKALALPPSNSFQHSIKNHFQPKKSLQDTEISNSEDIEDFLRPVFMQKFSHHAKPHYASKLPSLTSLSVLRSYMSLSTSSLGGVGGSALVGLIPTSHSNSFRCASVDSPCSNDAENIKFRGISMLQRASTRPADLYNDYIGSSNYSIDNKLDVHSDDVQNSGYELRDVNSTCKLPFTPSSDTSFSLRSCTPGDGLFAVASNFLIMQSQVLAADPASYLYFLRSLLCDPLMSKDDTRLEEDLESMGVDAHIITRLNDEVQRECGVASDLRLFIADQMVKKCKANGFLFKSMKRKLIRLSSNNANSDEYDDVDDEEELEVTKQAIEDRTNSNHAQINPEDTQTMSRLLGTTDIGDAYNHSASFQIISDSTNQDENNVIIQTEEQQPNDDEHDNYQENGHIHISIAVAASSLENVTPAIGGVHITPLANPRSLISTSGSLASHSSFHPLRRVSSTTSAVANSLSSSHLNVAVQNNSSFGEENGDANQGLQRSRASLSTSSQSHSTLLFNNIRRDSNNLLRRSSHQSISGASVSTAPVNQPSAQRLEALMNIREERRRKKQFSHNSSSITNSKTRMHFQNNVNSVNNNGNNDSKGIEGKFMNVKGRRRRGSAISSNASSVIDASSSPSNNVNQQFNSFNTSSQQPLHLNFSIPMTNQVVPDSLHPSIHSTHDNYINNNCCSISNLNISSSSSYSTYQKMRDKAESKDAKCLPPLLNSSNVSLSSASPHPPLLQAPASPQRRRMSFSSSFSSDSQSDGNKNDRNRSQKEKQDNSMLLHSFSSSSIMSNSNLNDIEDQINSLSATKIEDNSRNVLERRLDAFDDENMHINVSTVEQLIDPASSSNRTRHDNDDDLNHFFRNSISYTNPGMKSYMFPSNSNNIQGYDNNNNINNINNSISNDAEQNGEMTTIRRQTRRQTMSSEEWKDNSNISNEEYPEEVNDLKQPITNSDHIQISNHQSLRAESQCDSDRGISNTYALQHEASVRRIHRDDIDQELFHLNPSHLNSPFGETEFDPSSSSFRDRLLQLEIQESKKNLSERHVGTSSRLQKEVTLADNEKDKENINGENTHDGSQDEESSDIDEDEEDALMAGMQAHVAALLDVLLNLPFLSSEEYSKDEIRRREEAANIAVEFACVVVRDSLALLQEAALDLAAELEAEKDYSSDEWERNSPPQLNFDVHRTVLSILDSVFRISKSIIDTHKSIDLNKHGNKFTEDVTYWVDPKLMISEDEVASSPEKRDMKILLDITRPLILAVRHMDPPLPFDLLIDVLPHFDLLKVATVDKIRQIVRIAKTAYFHCPLSSEDITLTVDEKIQQPAELQQSISKNFISPLLLPPSVLPPSISSLSSKSISLLSHIYSKWFSMAPIQASSPASHSSLGLHMTPVESFCIVLTDAMSHCSRLLAQQGVSLVAQSRSRKNDSSSPSHNNEDNNTEEDTNKKKKKEQLADEHTQSNPIALPSEGSQVEVSRSISFLEEIEPQLPINDTDGIIIPETEFLSPSPFEAASINQAETAPQNLVTESVVSPKFSTTTNHQSAVTSFFPAPLFTLESTTCSTSILLWMQRCFSATFPPISERLSVLALSLKELFIDLPDNFIDPYSQRGIQPLGRSILSLNGVEAPNLDEVSLFFDQLQCNNLIGSQQALKLLVTMRDNGSALSRVLLDLHKQSPYRLVDISPYSKLGQIVVRSFEAIILASPSVLEALANFSTSLDDSLYQQELIVLLRPLWASNIFPLLRFYISLGQMQNHNLHDNESEDANSSIDDDEKKQESNLFISLVERGQQEVIESLNCLILFMYHRRAFEPLNYLGVAPQANNIDGDKGFVNEDNSDDEWEDERDMNPSSASPVLIRIIHEASEKDKSRNISPCKPKSSLKANPSTNSISVEASCLPPLPPSQLLIKQIISISTTMTTRNNNSKRNSITNSDDVNSDEERNNGIFQIPSNRQLDDQFEAALCRIGGILCLKSHIQMTCALLDETSNDDDLEGIPRGLCINIGEIYISNAGLFFKMLRKPTDGLVYVSHAVIMQIEDAFLRLSKSFVKITDTAAGYSATVTQHDATTNSSSMLMPHRSTIKSMHHHQSPPPSPTARAFLHALTLKSPSNAAIQASNRFNNSNNKHFRAQYTPSHLNSGVLIPSSPSSLHQLLTTPEGSLNRAKQSCEQYQSLPTSDMSLVGGAAIDPIDLLSLLSLVSLIDIQHIQQQQSLSASPSSILKPSPPSYLLAGSGLLDQITRSMTALPSRAQILLLEESKRGENETLEDADGNNTFEGLLVAKNQLLMRSHILTLVFQLFVLSSYSVSNYSDEATTSEINSDDFEDLHALECVSRLLNAPTPQMDQSSVFSLSSSLSSITSHLITLTAQQQSHASPIHFPFLPINHFSSSSFPVPPQKHVVEALSAFTTAHVNLLPSLMLLATGPGIETGVSFLANSSWVSLNALSLLLLLPPVATARMITNGLLKADIVSNLLLHASPLHGIFMSQLLVRAHTHLPLWFFSLPSPLKFPQLLVHSEQSSPFHLLKNEKKVAPFTSLNLSSIAAKLGDLMVDELLPSCVLNDNKRTLGAGYNNSYDVPQSEDDESNPEFDDVSENNLLDGARQQVESLDPRTELQFILSAQLGNSKKKRASDEKSKRKEIMHEKRRQEKRKKEKLTQRQIGMLGTQLSPLEGSVSLMQSLTCLLRTCLPLVSPEDPIFNPSISNKALFGVSTAVSLSPMPRAASLSVCSLLPSNETVTLLSPVTGYSVNGWLAILHANSSIILVNSESLVPISPFESPDTSSFLNCSSNYTRKEDLLYESDLKMREIFPDINMDEELDSHDLNDVLLSNNNVEDDSFENSQLAKKRRRHICIKNLKSLLSVSLPSLLETLANPPNFRSRFRNAEVCSDHPFVEDISDFLLACASLSYFSSSPLLSAEITPALASDVIQLLCSIDSPYHAAASYLSTTSPLTAMHCLANTPFIASTQKNVLVDQHEHVKHGAAIALTGGDPFTSSRLFTFLSAADHADCQLQFLSALDSQLSTKQTANSEEVENISLPTMALLKALGVTGTANPTDQQVSLSAAGLESLLETSTASETACSMRVSHVASLLQLSLSPPSPIPPTDLEAQQKQLLKNLLLNTPPDEDFPSDLPVLFASTSRLSQLMHTRRVGVSRWATFDLPLTKPISGIADSAVSSFLSFCLLPVLKFLLPLAQASASPPPSLWSAPALRFFPCHLSSPPPLQLALLALLRTLQLLPTPPPVAVADALTDTAPFKNSMGTNPKGAIVRRQSALANHSTRRASAALQALTPPSPGSFVRVRPAPLAAPVSGSPIGIVLSVSSSSSKVRIVLQKRCVSVPLSLIYVDEVANSLKIGQLVQLKPSFTAEPSGGLRNLNRNWKGTIQRMSREFALVSHPVSTVRNSATDLVDASEDMVMWWHIGEIMPSAPQKIEPELIVVPRANRPAMASPSRSDVFGIVQRHLESSPVSLLARTLEEFGRDPQVIHSLNLVGIDIHELISLLRMMGTDLSSLNEAVRALRAAGGHALVAREFLIGPDWAMMRENDDESEEEIFDSSGGEEGQNALLDDEVNFVVHGEDNISSMDPMLRTNPNKKKLKKLSVNETDIHLNLIKSLPSDDTDNLASLISDCMHIVYEQRKESLHLSLNHELLLRKSIAESVPTSPPEISSYTTIPSGSVPVAQLIATQTRFTTLSHLIFVSKFIDQRIMDDESFTGFISPIMHMLLAVSLSVGPESTDPLIPVVALRAFESLLSRVEVAPASLLASEVKFSMQWGCVASLLSHAIHTAYRCYLPSPQLADLLTSQIFHPVQRPIVSLTFAMSTTTSLSPLHRELIRLLMSVVRLVVALMYTTSDPFLCLIAEALPPGHAGNKTETDVRIMQNPPSKQQLRGLKWIMSLHACRVSIEQLSFCSIWSQMLAGSNIFKKMFKFTHFSDLQKLKSAHDNSESTKASDNLSAGEIALLKLQKNFSQNDHDLQSANLRTILIAQILLCASNHQISLREALRSLYQSRLAFFDAPSTLQLEELLHSDHEEAFISSAVTLHATLAAYLPVLSPGCLFDLWSDWNSAMGTQSNTNIASKTLSFEKDDILNSTSMLFEESDPLIRSHQIPLDQSIIELCKKYVSESNSDKSDLLVDLSFQDATGVKLKANWSITHTKVHQQHFFNVHNDSSQCKLDDGSIHVSGIHFASFKRSSVNEIIKKSCLAFANHPDYEENKFSLPLNNSVSPEFNMMTENDSRDDINNPYMPPPRRGSLASLVSVSSLLRPSSKNIPQTTANSSLTSHMDDILVLLPIHFDPLLSTLTRSSSFSGMNPISRMNSLAPRYKAPHVFSAHKSNYNQPAMRRETRRVSDPRLRLVSSRGRTVLKSPQGSVGRASTFLSQLFVPGKVYMLEFAVRTPITANSVAIKRRLQGTHMAPLSDISPLGGLPPAGSQSESLSCEPMSPSVYFTVASASFVLSQFDPTRIHFDAANHGDVMWSFDATASPPLPLSPQLTQATATGPSLLEEITGGECRVKILIDLRSACTSGGAEDNQASVRFVSLPLGSRGSEGLQGRVKHVVLPIETFQSASLLVGVEILEAGCGVALLKSTELSGSDVNFEPSNDSMNVHQQSINGNKCDLVSATSEINEGNEKLRVTQMFKALLRLKSEFDFSEQNTLKSQFDIISQSKSASQGKDRIQRKNDVVQCIENRKNTNVLLKKSSIQQKLSVEENGKNFSTLIACTMCKLKLNPENDIFYTCSSCSYSAIPIKNEGNSTGVGESSNNSDDRLLKPLQANKPIFCSECYLSSPKFQHNPFHSIMVHNRFIETKNISGKNKKCESEHSSNSPSVICHCGAPLWLLPASIALGKNLTASCDMCATMIEPDGLIFHCWKNSGGKGHPRGFDLCTLCALLFAKAQPNQFVLPPEFSTTSEDTSGMGLESYAAASESILFEEKSDCWSISEYCSLQGEEVTLSDRNGDSEVSVDILEQDEELRSDASDYEEEVFDYAIDKKQKNFKNSFSLEDTRSLYSIPENKNIQTSIHHFRHSTSNSRRLFPLSSLSVSIRPSGLSSTGKASFIASLVRLFLKHSTALAENIFSVQGNKYSTLSTVTRTALIELGQFLTSLSCALDPHLNAEANNFDSKIMQILLHATLPSNVPISVAALRTIDSEFAAVSSTTASPVVASLSVSTLFASLPVAHRMMCRHLALGRMLLLSRLQLTFESASAPFLDFSAASSSKEGRMLNDITTCGALSGASMKMINGDLIELTSRALLKTSEFVLRLSRKRTSDHPLDFGSSLLAQVTNVLGGLYVPAEKMRVPSSSSLWNTNDEPVVIAASQLGVAVAFAGEGGIDQGGLLRELTDLLVEESQNKQFLFKPTSSLAPLTRLSSQITTSSQKNLQGDIQQNGREFYIPRCDRASLGRKRYWFIFGVLMGLSLRGGHILPLSLDPYCWRRLSQLGNSAALLSSVNLFYLYDEASLTGSHLDREREREWAEGLRSLSDECYQRYTFLSKLANISSEEFTDDSIDKYDSWALHRITSQAEAKYLSKQLLLETIGLLDLPLSWILQGLSRVLPTPLILSPSLPMPLVQDNRLETMISGQAEVDIELLKKRTLYINGLTSNSPVSIWLWEILMHDFTPAERNKFLRFSWGRSRLPSDKNGSSFQMILNRLSVPRAVEINSDGVVGSDQYMPVAHTCMFQLSIPEYSCKSIFVERLRYAMDQCVMIDADIVHINLDEWKEVEENDDEELEGNSDDITGVVNDNQA